MQDDKELFGFPILETKIIPQEIRDKRRERKLLKKKERRQGKEAARKAHTLLISRRKESK